MTVTIFNYLGSVVTDEGSKPEIFSRIAQTTGPLTVLKPIWFDKSSSSARRYNSCTPLSHSLSCMLVNHGPWKQSSKIEYRLWIESSTITYCAFLTKNMLPMKMWRSSRQMDYAKISQFWRCNGHISHSSSLDKSILQGTVKGGGRKQGRQRKSWEDNVKEWTSLDFSKSQQTEVNMESRRNMVAKWSVVP